MIILEKPNFPPYVCIVCWVGDDRRKWYVDLQFALDHYFNPVNDGAIYVCNECWDGIVRELASQLQNMTFKEPSYQGIIPTYDNKSELLTEVTVGKRPTAPGPELSIPDFDAAGTAEISTGSDQPTESDDSELDASSDDAESESVREFRGFFEPAG